MEFNFFNNENNYKKKFLIEKKGNVSAEWSVASIIGALQIGKSDMHQMMLYNMMGKLNTTEFGVSLEDMFKEKFDNKKSQDD